MISQNTNIKRYFFGAKTLFFIIYYVVQTLVLASMYTPDFEQDVRNCKPDCESQIYCNGELLNDVQLSKLYGSGKGTTFVEKKLLYPENEIVEKYKKLKSQVGGTPSKDQLRKFVNENLADDPLEPCEFPDFNPNPNILNATKEEKYKKWLGALNELWKKLGGRISLDVQKMQDRHSYLYVPNRFIKAGGQFTGIYYWDSYWIIRGLLLSGMNDTAKGIIENIIYLVKEYDHMPNGNRVYYKTRSQPPMLIQMAALYYAFTNNIKFLQDNMKFFEKEFSYWMKNRSIKVKINNNEYLMFRYKSISCVPRPESYAEDYELVKNINSETEKVRIFTGIRSAAETGWDFSSRHIRDPAMSNDNLLLQMEPQNMIYVDLNSIMHANAKLLGSWNEKLGSKDTAEYYRGIANNLKKAIETVLWNDNEGTWFDYDLISKKPKIAFYISNLTPLWSRSFSNEKYVVERSINYLVRQGIIEPAPKFTPKFYCVPTSTINSTQQWDYPNCWAPLQGFLIHGLHLYKDISPDAETIAFNLAQEWIKTTYQGYYKNHVMYEKYSAIEFGSTGGGGEYSPQTGFGWTNGFCMELFSLWGSELK